MSFGDNIHEAGYNLANAFVAFVVGLVWCASAELAFSGEKICSD